MKVNNLKEQLYSTQVDGTTLFRSIICQRLHPSNLLLDLGAGKGKPKTDFRKFCKMVIGLDIAQNIRDNSFVTYSLQGRIEQLPFRDGSFNVVFADYVLEHLQQPIESLQAVLRVLKPGGYFIFRTPNVLHYTSLIGYLTPHFFHKLVANRARGIQGGPEHQIFSKAYKINTRHKVKKLCQKVGFITIELIMVEKEPSYLVFCRTAFLLGYAYERIVNRLEVLQDLRANILGILRKPEKQ